MELSTLQQNRRCRLRPGFLCRPRDPVPHSRSRPSFGWSGGEQTGEWQLACCSPGRTLHHQRRWTSVQVMGVEQRRDTPKAQGTDIEGCQTPDQMPVKLCLRPASGEAARSVVHLHNVFRAGAKDNDAAYIRTCVALNG
ncbi:hypothetical protein CGRA01v4_10621 [Colletotrichum graminicola]|nr:hypothetical protein CGRA01v4_10621 [Colletotrichum graminicola]